VQPGPPAHREPVATVPRSPGLPDNRQRVLDATDIVRLVGDHVSLKPKGREYACVCPFHDDHNPSMYVVPNKQIFHCFVCGSGGNAIDFVMKFHGMEFRAALEFLAERAGIELERVGRAGSERGAGRPAGPTRDELARVNAFALEFFRTILKHESHGRRARDVLEHRGISAEMIERFEIGAAPDRWDGLLQTATGRGVSRDHLLNAGLVKPKENGGAYDALRNRVVFPIADQIGRTVAFGARRIDEEDTPKYLNSPETVLFDKSATLFGLKQALRSIQNSRQAVITEGYTDVIACHQAGFANVVATLGTALTPGHATILRRLCDSIVLLFDGDEAGMSAADRAIEVFLTEPVDVKIALLPGGKDPDDLLKEDGGPETFARAIEGATDALEHRFARLEHKLRERGLAPGSVRRARELEAEVEKLVDMGLGRLPPIRQQTIVSKLARLGGVGVETIQQTIRQVRGAPRRGRAGAEVEGKPGAGAQAGRGRWNASDTALGCLLAEPSIWDRNPGDARDFLARGAYSSSSLEEVARALSDAADENQSRPTLQHLLLRLEHAESRSEVVGLVRDLETQTDGDGEQLARIWSECVALAEWQSSGGNTERENDIEARIGSLRQSHARLGSNPLAMPRPRAGPV